MFQIGASHVCTMYGATTFLITFVDAFSQGAEDKEILVTVVLSLPATHCIGAIEILML